MKTNALSMVLLALFISASQLFGRREEVCNVNANVGTHTNGIIPLECQTAAPSPPLLPKVTSSKLPIASR